MGYFSNRLKVPVNIVIEQSEWNKNITKHPNQKFWVWITNLESKWSLSKMVIPKFKIIITCETFENADLRYVNIYLQVNGISPSMYLKSDEKWRISKNSDQKANNSNMLNSVMIAQLVESLANLKAHIHLEQINPMRIPSFKFTKEIAVQQQEMPQRMNKSTISAIKKKTMSRPSNAPVESEVRLETFVQEEVEVHHIYEEERSYKSDESAKTFDLISDIGIEVDKMTLNDQPLGKKINHTAENGREETKEVPMDQGTVDGKCYKDGEWTKWVTEQWTPEQLEMFQETKQMIIRHLEKENPEAIDRYIDDNLILRFWDDNDFKDPEVAVKNIVYSIEYLEKYEYHSLTKEKIIDVAEGIHKEVFDCCLHSFAGPDKHGRPVVVFKIRNINKKVFADLDISRLYMLYVVSTH